MLETNSFRHIFALFQICLVYAKTELMCKSVMAHNGPVCILDAAYHSAHSKSYTPTLVSCGKDLQIKIWHITLVDNRHGMISLRLTYSVSTFTNCIHLGFNDFLLNFLCEM